jgi:DNA-binding XRE family transcriptional regulator
MKNKKVKKVFEKVTKDMYFDTILKEDLKDPVFKAGFERERKLLAVTLELLQLRRRRHMSQRALAKKAKVPQQEISNIEQGRRNITLNTLQKLANGLNADIDIIVRPHSA